MLIEYIEAKLPARWLTISDRNHQMTRMREHKAKILVQAQALAIAQSYVKNWLSCDDSTAATIDTVLDAARDHVAQRLAEMDNLMARCALESVPHTSMRG